MKMAIRRFAHRFSQIADRFNFLQMTLLDFAHWTIVDVLLALDHY